jgi:hypothetical protein
MIGNGNVKQKVSCCGGTLLPTCTHLVPRRPRRPHPSHVPPGPSRPDHGLAPCPSAHASGCCSRLERRESERRPRWPGGLKESAATTLDAEPRGRFGPGSGTAARPGDCRGQPLPGGPVYYTRYYTYIWHIPGLLLPYTKHEHMQGIWHYVCMPRSWTQTTCFLSLCLTLSDDSDPQPSLSDDPQPGWRRAGQTAQPCWTGHATRPPSDLPPPRQSIYLTYLQAESYLFIVFSIA